MISTVLVPLDGTTVAEQAIPYAQALLPDGGRVILFRVVPEPEPPLIELLWTLESPENATSEAARAALETTIARAHDARLRWEARVAQGHPAEQILQAAGHGGVDMVIMMTAGRGAIGRAVFGSVADRVSRASPVPVLLVRPRPESATATAAEIRRLVVPLDGSQLAEAALPPATEIARRRGILVSLVQAIDLTALLTPVSAGGVLTVPLAPEVYEQTVATVERGAREYLAAVAAGLQAEGVDASWTVLEGSPFFAIADATQPGDLIVMTSHGRGGVRRWLLGSVAEKLVREADAPVLLVGSSPGR